MLVNPQSFRYLRTFIFSGPKFIRRLNWEHLSIGTFDKSLENMMELVTDPHLFHVNEEKLVFCGPEIDDGCKTTRTFFDEIEESIPYPSDWVTRKISDYSYWDFENKETSDYSFGVANSEIISLTIDFPGYVYFFLEFWRTIVLPIKSSRSRSSSKFQNLDPKSPRSSSGSRKNLIPMSTLLLIYT